MANSLTDLAGLKVGTEDFLAAVLEAAAQPIWVVDPDGLIRFANPAALAALGYDSADELFGRHSHNTIHHSYPDGTPYPAADCPLLRAGSSAATTTSELDWFFRRDGSMFPVSYTAVPVKWPDGHGAVVAFTDIEDRRNAEQVLRDHGAVLSAQQAGLRRVAALVSGGAPSAEVFAAIAREVGRVLRFAMVATFRYEADGTVAVVGAWGDRPHPFHAGTRWPLDGLDAQAEALLAGRPARIEDFAALSGAIASTAHAINVRSGAYAPIIVDGEPWGVMGASPAAGQPLPDLVEHRLMEFTELVGAAIANTQSRDQLARLADEQATLRRVATLVAHGVAPTEVFGAVARELGELLGVDATHMGRYSADGKTTSVATWGVIREHLPLGTPIGLEGDNVSGLVLRTGQAARMDSFEGAAGSVAGIIRDLGIRSSVGAPIIVDERLWGTIIVSSTREEPLPADTEARITAFSELVATAISNTETQAERDKLGAQQAALRRVATLVAQDVPPDDLFAAVAEEVGRLTGSNAAGMVRYEDDQTMTAVAAWSASEGHRHIPGRWPLDGPTVTAMVYKTGAPVRIDDYSTMTGVVADYVRTELGIKAAVASPIVVEGRLWGALSVNQHEARPFPADTESRVASFASLVATAVGNAQARAEVKRLADEQAALRRVATLVAEGAPPAKVFEAVGDELAQLLSVPDMRMVRYGEDDVATIVSSRGDAEDALPVGTRMLLGGHNICTLVNRTGSPARIDDYREATGEVAEHVRKLDARSALGCPIVVDGQVWGAMLATSRQEEPMPPGTENRIGEFTELVATAISNIEARADLAASRARIVAATDDERRRVVRDLHDGAQQRLVHTVVMLKLARRALEEDREGAPELITGALDHAERATGELRELAHGILPAVLTRGGLRAGIGALASRMPVPVEMHVLDARLPPVIEATAYFVIAEALTNVVKHARAERAAVTAWANDECLRIEVRDDGIGGANPDGSGLVGLQDRLATLDGKLRIESPEGGGTLIAATLPCSGHSVAAVDL